MATFLTAQGVSWHVQSIVNNAQQRLFIVSPHLALSPSLLQSIQTVGAKVPTSIIYREWNLSDDLLEKLRHIRKLSLLQNSNLYARCYFNEHAMVLTSMSLSEYEKTDNWEMGVLIDRELDTSLYQSAFDEVIKISDASKVIKSQDNRTL